MDAWYTFVCEVMLVGIIGTLAGMIIIGFIGYVIDRLREKKERRKILNEKYIRYRIERWNREGY